MTDDIDPGSNYRIELIYLVEAGIEGGASHSLISSGRLAEIQGSIEQAIVQEFQNDPVLVLADVRFQRPRNASDSRRRCGSPSSSKKNIILKLLESKDGVTTKGLRSDRLETKHYFGPTRLPLKRGLPYQ